jgi:hypothetical protein
MVEGTFIIHGCPVTTLIDLDSMNSIVNETCACQLDWVGKELPYVMYISTLLGKVAVANRYVPDCKILVGREVLKAELIVMPIILGLDWL